VLHAYKVYLPDTEGGIPTAIRQLCAGLRERFSPIVLATRRFGTPVTMRVDSIQVVRTLSLGNALSMPLAPFYPIWFWLMARRADIVACHAPFPLIDLALALWFPRRTALVVHWYAEIVAQKRALTLVAPFIRHTLRRADRIVVSHPRMIDASPFLRPFAAKCSIVPFGVDMARWSALGRADLAEIEAIRAHHPRLIVAIGRLVGYKGYPVLIEAMKQVNAICMIVGDGKLRESLAADIVRHGVQDRVMLCGRLPFEDIRRLLHASGLFVMPSTSAAETFGISQIEAMACGCAIVNTDLPTAVPFVARNGQEGLTVPPGDVDALAEALNRLLDDADFRAGCATAAVLRARETFSETAFLAASAAIYAETAGLRATPSPAKFPSCRPAHSGNPLLDADRIPGN
jgi:glycosyltransferase involved in cell wall biosynthesis